MKIGLSTSLHLDHGRLSLDQRSGDQPFMQAFVPIGLLSLKAVLDRTVQDIDTRVIELNGMINEGRIRNDEDLSRLGLESSDLADLVRYEEAKLDARGLSDPTRNKTIISQLEPQTVVGTRCSYVTESFRYDLQSLLDGRRTEAALDGEFWIIFAKTSQNFVETIQTRRPGRKLLDLTWDPHTVAELVDKLKSEEDLDDERSVRLIRQLCDRGVLGEVCI